MYRLALPFGIIIIINIIIQFEKNICVHHVYYGIGGSDDGFDFGYL